MILQMKGDIVGDDWAWLYEYFQEPYCCPKMIRDALKVLPEGESLILEINSPGGFVSAGFEMYGILRGCKRPTEAHIIALAASAATTLMIGCDRVLASPVAQIMIHQPSTYADVVNNREAKALLQFLDSIKASILDGYQIKCRDKASRQKLEQLVDASTWMPAKDAIALGLVDELLDVSEEESEVLKVSAGKLIGVVNAVGGSGPYSLLARYEEAVRNGAEPAPGHPVAAPVTSVNDTRPAGGFMLTPTGLILCENGEQVLFASAPAAADAEADSVEASAPAWQQQARIDLERERCRA